jgi:hypothetical protein
LRAAFLAAFAVMYRIPTMTVCIAALADDGRSAVLAADQMTTHGFLSWAVEDEHVPKIHQITDTAAILTSGDATLSHEIVKKVRAEWPQDPELAFIEAVRLAYATFRATKIEHLLLNARNLTFQTYYQQHATLQPETVRELDSRIAAFDLGVQLIAIRFESEVCSVAAIWNPGVTHALDSVGYACIGEGGPHATYAMLDLDYSRALPLARVAAIVKEAKRRSEKAPSVGQKTTLCFFPFTLPQPDSAPAEPAARDR